MAERVDIEWFCEAVLDLLGEVDEHARWNGATESPTPIADAIHELAVARLEDESPGGDTLFEIERLSR